MAQPSVKKRKMSRQAKREMVSGYLFLLPNFLGFFIFTAIPIIAGLILSFTDYNGFTANFVGLDNYAKFFRDSQFQAALVNNLIYSALSVPLTILFALLLALMLNRPMRGGGFFKTVYFFPNLTSMVAVGCVAMLLFQPDKGPVNQLLLALGVPQDSLPQWFFSTKTALYTVILVVVWKQAGYYMIMFMGGLKNIPPHLYEAAKIDGAGEMRIFWTIVMPNIKPAWLTLMVFSVQQLWNMGSSVFIYSEQLKTLSYAINQIVAGGSARAGVGSAVIVVMMIVPIVVFIFTQSNIIETMASSGLKD